MSFNEGELKREIEALGRLHGKKSLILADELDKLAAQRERCGLLNQAEFFYSQSLEVRRHLLGKEHLGIVKSLNHLGKLYARQGDYVKSRPFFSQALAIRRRKIGPTHSKTLRSIIHLANVYLQQRIWNKAESLYDEALASAQKKYGNDHAETAEYYVFLGNLYSSQGLYERARPYYVKALQVKQTALGQDHLRTARYLEVLSDLFIKQGFYEEAEIECQKALTIRRRRPGRDCLNIIKNLHRLSDIYVEQGVYTKAEPLCLEALALARKNTDHDDPVIVQSLDRLARIYLNQSRYSKAKILFERSLEICRTNLEPCDAGLVQHLHNLADVCENQGQYRKAEELYSEALAISKSAFGTEHQDCAISLNNLSLLYEKQGLHAKAEACCHEASSITRRAFGARHRNTATNLNNLATLYRRQGRHEKAKTLYLKALVIMRKNMGDRHPDIATILNNLALLKHLQGSNEAAERLYKESLFITQEALGKDHRESVIILNNLARLYFKQGLYAKAQLLFREAFVSQLLLLQREAPILPQSERMSFFRSLNVVTDVFYSCATISYPTAELALFARLNCQGLLERIERRQAQLASIQISLLDEVKELRALVQRLASKSISSEERSALKARQDELERQLYCLLPEHKPTILQLELVASALQPTSALVEFQRYLPFDGSTHDGRLAEARFLALILKSDHSVTAVDIGPAVVLEAAIEEARNLTIQCFADSSSPWEQISERLLSPLLPYLENINTWYFSLDGELHRIPMHILPLPNQPDHLLVESVSLRLVSSGHDLLDQIATSQQNASAGAALVVADPAFDFCPKATSSDEPDSSNHQLRSRDMDLFEPWEPLPGTAEEGTKVAELLYAQLLTGSDATTLAVQKAHQPRILHIATHGFFLPEQPEHQQGQRWLTIDRQDLVASFSGEDPMLRSGLVLAGANIPVSDPDEDDGYLTAMEAVHLNLHGTELITLSACHSGSGDIQTGEGVYGLQRAFIVAGARSLLLSLWPVPDDATCAFMVRFYTHLKEGLGRYEALIRVQQEFRQHENIVWRHPYYWGAWQLMGDWRPIEGL